MPAIQPDATSPASGSGNGKNAAAAARAGIGTNAAAGPAFHVAAPLAAASLLVTPVALAGAPSASPATAASGSGASPAPGAAAASATINQVANALVQLGQPVVAARTNTLTLHLAPPALGDVTIRISARHGAAAVVTITASHQASAEALATARPSLEASLLRAGLPADTRVIVHSPNPGPSGGERSDRGPRQHGGQPRRPPLLVRSDSEPDFADTLDISA